MLRTVIVIAAFCSSLAWATSPIIAAGNSRKSSRPAVDTDGKSR